jgi:hypothetical protein
MLTAAVAPELVLAYAAHDWASANAFAKRMKDAGFDRWTRVHGYYADMGGFGQSHHGQRLDADALSRIVRSGQLPAEPEVTEMMINDKSKADYLVKLAACTQALWLVVQSVGRAVQGLALSTLELSTIAFVVMALGIYIF